jgi:hypothetical protein
MTNTELYNSYLASKATIQILQTQLMSLSEQLHDEETKLIEITQQIRDLGDQALFNTLLG